MKYLVALLLLVNGAVCLASPDVARYWHGENYTPVVLEFHLGWKCAANINNQVICWRDM
jgi:hypothetical protein